MTALRVVVLISGSGSNLQAFIDAAAAGQLPIDIAAVISNRADAYGLERAARTDIPGHVLDHRGFRTRESYDRELSALIDRYDPGLIVMAGFMRILSSWFVDRYPQRIVNIHPSLLPDYPGLHTHRRVLAAGETRHGASVHFVIPELDAGPVIIQGRLAVLPGDTPDSLQQRIHKVEHVIYPRAVGWFAEGRLSVGGGRVLLDGRARDEQLVDF